MSGLGCGQTDSGAPQLVGKQLDEMEHVQSEEELNGLELQ